MRLITLFGGGGHAGSATKEMIIMISRRQFMGSSAAAVVAAGTMGRGTVFGANDRIQVCCCGIHGQGGSHMRDLLQRDDVDIVALCDVDSNVLEERVRQVKEAKKKKPKAYKDIREALENKKIDAITIATPNHWHSLMAIWGCQAGKDVYVEKPLSHSLWEGRQLVAAAEKNKRIVMHGTQSRSNDILMRDMKLIHEGFIGDIIHSRGYVYKNGNRGAIGHGKPGQAPENLDWALWQGPSTDHDFMVKEDGTGLYVHYNWHWFWEYGNGEIGNQGVHEMDLAVWGHNRGLPVKVYSTGGRWGLDDDGQTPNTQATSFTYADGTILTFEVRNLGSFPEGGENDCSNSWFGTKGYYVRGKGFFDYKRNPIEVPADAQKPEDLGKWGYWLKAIRSRNTADMTAPATAGHLSCVHCHLGNIAYRLGRSLEFDPKTETFKDAEANKFLKREYRKGFEVPQLA
jgi:predicted dehydrogenase